MKKYSKAFRKRKPFHRKKGGGTFHFIGETKFGGASFSSESEKVSFGLYIGALLESLARKIYSPQKI